MKLLTALLFCVSLCGQTLDLRSVSILKPDAYVVTVPNIGPAFPGNTLHVIIAYDPAGITSATWRGVQMSASTGAANFGKGGRNYTSGARTVSYMIQFAHGTGDLQFTFSRETYANVIAVYESDFRYPDSGVGAPPTGWAGPTANPATGFLPWQNSPTELLIAALATEGPQSDAPGSWPPGWTDCGRWGTVGGKADANITLSVGCRVVDTVGPYSVSKSGITPRYWALSLGSYEP